MSDAVLRVGVEAIELRGPGLNDWMTGRAVLAGREPYHAATIGLNLPELLSPAERRRAVPAVKLALAVGAGAVEQSGHDPRTLPAVYASSNADGDTIDVILSALTTADREVSPTRFHNSVHNAPSGYWGVAMHSREAVSSVSGFDASFAAGLVEACVTAVSDQRSVLLVAYDLPYPEPLNSVRRIAAGFGVAFVLSPAPSSRALAELHVSMAVTPAGEASRCSDRGLEELRCGNPAARCLPLLIMLATQSVGGVRLDFNGPALDVAVLRC